MEHSRLLKFLTDPRYKNIMSESPSIKIQRDYESPPNISAEVPGEQKIREMDATKVADTDVTVTDTSSEVTDSDFSLSPVITVTKKETTLTKGDMKLQKVTVTEDIARQDIENGEQSISYSEFHTTVQTNKQTVTRTMMSNEYKDTTQDKESNSLEQKRSRIPKLKFRQTVERVKRERREQNSKEQPHLMPRRSSIPKLKDATLVKRKASLKHDWKPAETQAEEKLDEEFDKIYEEIADSKQNDIDDKILAVKIEDPEKIETKFEEIIHAYDSNDDNYLTPTEKLRTSKIPWRKKDRDQTTKLGSLVDKVQTKSFVTNNNLKDGGFKVSATTITTKRFSRGNSMDINNQKVDVYETINTADVKDGGVIKETTITETIERLPIKTEVIFRSIDKEIDLIDPDSMEIDETYEPVNKSIDIVEDDTKLSKEKPSRLIKTGIPVKPARINRGISRDLNKRPVSLDDRDFVNSKVVKHEELIDGKSQTVFREKVIKERAIGAERITRGLNRTFSRDGKSITVSTKTKDVSIAGSKIPVAGTFIKENNIVLDVETKQLEEQNDQTNPTTVTIKKEILTTENIAKDSNKVGIPVYTKTTHSYTKGVIQNVELSKTIEWKPAEIKIKRYGRSYSEQKPANGDIMVNKFTPTMVEGGKTMHEKITQDDMSIFTKAPEIIKNTDTEVLVINDSKKIDSNSLNDSVNITPIKVDIEVTELKTLEKDSNSKPIDITKEIVHNENDSISKPIDITREIVHNEKEVPHKVKDIPHKVTDIPDKVKDIPHKLKDTEYNKVPKQDESKQTVTILKGNVNRLISQISVNDSKDITKKDKNIQDELPKKKSVLSKIAMFEGKDPAELNIKIKKCTIDKKRNFEETPKPVEQIFKPLIANSTKDFGNEPVIVDQIWKIREEDVQNLTVLHAVEEVRILPETVDFSVSENTVTVYETVKTLPGQLQLDAQKTLSAAEKLQEKDISVNVNEPIKALPALIVEEPQIIPVQIDFKIKEKHNDLKITIPAKIDFISNDDKEDIVKYLPEQVVTEDQKEIEKLRVGKLDLNFWQKQVEVNKKFVGTGKAIDKGQTQVDNSNLLIERNKNKNYKNENEIVDIPKTPTKIYIKPDSPVVEMPTILPARINSTPVQSERPTTLPGKLEPATSESQLQVPVTLPETPLMKPVKNNFETQTSHIEIPVILPGKIEVSKKIYTFEKAKHLHTKTSASQILQETKSVSKESNRMDHSHLTEQNNMKTDLNNQVPVYPTQQHNINSEKYEDGTFTKHLRPSDNNNKQTEKKYTETEISFSDDNAVPVYGQYNISTGVMSEPVSLKYDINKSYNLSSDLQDTVSENITILPEELKPLGIQDYEPLDKEIPSDPELVDSEPEIKEAKETIMGKLKNKIYLIANKKINAKKAAEQNKSPDIVHVDNDFKNNEDYIINNETEYKSYENVTYEYNNVPEHYKSYDEIEKSDSESKDDLRRAKSLAELDLGDVVKGQVQRMVYRIKSVDFDKPEINKTNKINAKEMPKKSSVLEKIALFEGKAGTNFTERPFRQSKLERQEIKEIATNNINMSTSVSNVTPDENFLAKVEELSSAKLKFDRTDMLYVRLCNEEHMPVIALGTALMDQRLAPHIVSGAIDLGFRAIDTAYIYGNEKAIGEGIKMKIDDGTIQRENLYIISKLWSTFHRPDLVETACRASLEAMGLEYFDLYLIHNPMSFKEGSDPIPKIASVLQFSDYDYLDAWYAMEQLVRKGLVKSIGVSNFNSKQIQRILDKGRVKPVVNQVECHPYLSQERLQKFCDARNIVLQCFGIMGAKGTPVDYKSSVGSPVIDDPMVKVMASALSVTPGRLLVRYQIEAGRAVIISSSSAAHLWDNLQALTFQIKKHEVDALTALNKTERIYTFKGMGDTHKNYPFREPF